MGNTGIFPFTSREIMSNGVEMESGNPLFSGDGCWFLFLPHSLFQVNSYLGLDARY
jgi:hypothetical protein